MLRDRMASARGERAPTGKPGTATPTSPRPADELVELAGPRPSTDSVTALARKAPVRDIAAIAAAAAYMLRFWREAPSARPRANRR